MAVVGGPAPEAPRLARILLGLELRRLRESAGVSRQDAARCISGSEAKLSRLEAGLLGVKQDDVNALLTLYGVVDVAQRAALGDRARLTRRPGWWRAYGDILPTGVADHIGLEEAAGLIRTYDVTAVPVLLQTEEYARAMLSAVRPSAPEDEIERRINLLRTRQRILSRPDPPRLWAIIDEAVIHAVRGGPQVMRGQIQRLIDHAALPHVTLQVLPLSRARPHATSEAFTVLRFGDSELPDMVCIQLLTNDLFLDRTSDLDAYLALINHLSIDAALHSETVEFLTRALDRVSTSLPD